MPKADAVRTMFSGIAGRYDKANLVLSGGIDRLWRRRLVKLVGRRNPQSLADLATGSGDVAFALRRGLGKNVKITGLDFCPPMLAEAEKKRDADNSLAGIDFRVGDCLSLPLADESVDVVTISFGLRNLEDRQRGLKEMRRVLRPGGALFVLEFTQPDRWFRPLYYFYLKNILPTLARWTTGNRDAYDYLAGSIEAFPTKESLAGEMKAAGFKTVQAEGLTFSITAIHTAEK